MVSIINVPYINYRVCTLLKKISNWCDEIKQVLYVYKLQFYIPTEKNLTIFVKYFFILIFIFTRLQNANVT